MCFIFCGHLRPTRQVLFVLIALCCARSSADAALGGGSPPSEEDSKAEVCDDSSCGKHGTAIDWVSPPQAAEVRSRVEDKPLMVVHVSGNFAKPQFT